LAVVTQIINAMSLPLVFYYLIRLASNKELMGNYANSKFQKYFTIISTVLIFIASVFTLISIFVKL